MVHPTRTLTLRFRLLQSRGRGDKSSLIMIGRDSSSGDFRSLRIEDETDMTGRGMEL